MGQKRRWNFPSNNFGQIFGIADSGVETFKGTPMKSLAREICQNSLLMIRADSQQKSNSRHFGLHLRTFRISRDYTMHWSVHWSSGLVKQQIGQKFFLRRHSLLQKTPKSLACVLVTTTQQDSREREKNITLRGVTWRSHPVRQIKAGAMVARSV